MMLTEGGVELMKEILCEDPLYFTITEDDGAGRLRRGRSFGGRFDGSVDGGERDHNSISDSGRGSSSGSGSGRSSGSGSIASRELEPGEVELMPGGRNVEVTEENKLE